MLDLLLVLVGGTREVFESHGLVATACWGRVEGKYMGIYYKHAG